MADITNPGEGTASQKTQIVQSRPLDHLEAKNDSEKLNSPRSILSVQTNQLLPSVAKLWNKHRHQNEILWLWILSKQNKFWQQVLEKLAKSLSKPLLLIIRTIFKGTLPEIRKLGQITLVFKTGDESSIVCLRPVSLLCSTSKEFEKLLLDTIYSKVSHILQKPVWIPSQAFSNSSTVGVSETTL